MKHVYKVIYNLSVYIETLDLRLPLNVNYICTCILKSCITFDRLYLINGTSYDQSLYETHMQVIYMYGLLVYLIKFDLG